MKLNKRNNLLFISLFLIFCFVVTTYAEAQSNRYPPVPSPKRVTKTVNIQNRGANKPPTNPPKRSRRSSQENIEKANPPTMPPTMPPVNTISKQEVQERINNARPHTKPPTRPEPGNFAEGTGEIKEGTVDISSAIGMSIKKTHKSIDVSKSIKKIKTGSLKQHKVVPLNVTKGKVSKKPYQKK